jgi:dCMP deaminase
MEENELKWHKRFLEICNTVASWSKDTRTKTGCVIVKDRRILTTGFNGFPPGVDDTKKERFEAPEKYLYTEHCDRNAIYQAARMGIKLEGAEMYLTGPPCHDCSRGIVMSGLIAAYWPENNLFEKEPERFSRWKESLEASFNILKEAGVKMVRVS